MKEEEIYDPLWMRLLALVVVVVLYSTIVGFAVGCGAVFTHFFGPF